MYYYDKNELTPLDYVSLSLFSCHEVLHLHHYLGILYEMK
jgi:hypothetical protein